ncbi:MAG: dat [Gemmataceae bacterium]|nr:dat [Gemmataceae bacterium]
MSLVWINGRLVDKADARVSPFDHGFLYGDGVWEHLRVFGGTLFRPAGALSHLHTSAVALGIDIPLSAAHLLEAVETTVRANHRTEGYVRVIVTRGPGTIGPDPRKLDPQVIVTAEEYHPFPLELYGHGLHAAVSPVRVDVSNPALQVRSLGRPHVVLAKAHALRAGCLEAVLLSADGMVVGGTEGTFFLVRDGAVTPLPAYPPDEVWRTVIEVAREAGPPVPVTATPFADLLAADEVFLAGTSGGVIGIVRVDGQDIGTGTEGPFTRAVRERYRAVTRGG